MLGIGCSALPTAAGTGNAGVANPLAGLLGQYGNEEEEEGEETEEGPGRQGGAPGVDAGPASAVDSKVTLSVV